MRAAVIAFLALLVSLPIASQTCPTPAIGAPPASLSTVPYRVLWNPIAGATSFEFEESTDSSFAGATRSTVIGESTREIPARPALDVESRSYYRVRTICGSITSPFSATVSTIVSPPPSQTSRRFDITIPAEALELIRLDLLIPGFGESATNEDRFGIAPEALWATVFPVTGALSAGGTTIQVTIDPALIPVGTTSTTINISRNGGVVPLIHIPLSVTRSNPVVSSGRPRGYPEGTLIIPAIAHAAGFNSQFRSDVRILNTSDTTLSFDLTFTPAGTDGTSAGKKTVIEIDPNETKAFDDIVLSVFGSGVLGEAGAGTLEIRPQREGFAGDVLASSRTYNVNDVGTFGQFVPALDLGSFTSAGVNISLQQLVFNVRYRTNLGFVEGKGEPVQFLVKLFDEDGTLIRTATQSLAPYEFRQVSFASLFPEVSIDDARVEIEVTSQTGLVTAYGSVLDNDTADPFLVFPVLPAKQASRPRYVVAGIAEINSANNFHSDMRIYNPTSSPQTVTLSYRPQTGDSTPVPEPLVRTIAAGAIDVINDVLPTLWGLNGTGGAVSVASGRPVVVTARTFSRNAAGTTYGLFIPAVTAADDSEGIGANELNILQLEQSANFRTNLGLAETTGEGSVLVLIEGITGTGSAFKEVILGPGEFRQIGRIFTDLGSNRDVYNGRIRIRPITGSGRVSAYGAVVDNRTEDPTYVPAQRR